jgi:hypothetical protein
MQEKIKPIKIKNTIEAEIIIKETEDLIKKGHKLTEKQRYDYEFARIFLTSIKKRRKKKGDEEGQI